MSILVAKEAPDFYTYYNSRVAGGTKVASAFQLVNQIVKNDNLAQDYNIYVFHGTDGDDWDKDGKEMIPELILNGRLSNTHHTYPNLKERTWLPHIMNIWLNPILRKITQRKLLNKEFLILLRRIIWMI